MGGWVPQNGSGELQEGLASPSSNPYLRDTERVFPNPCLSKGVLSMSILEPQVKLCA